MRSGRVGAALVLCLCVAACGSSPNPKPAAPSAPITTTAPAVQLTPCGLGAHAFWLHGPHGMRLEANTIGTGNNSAVLLHEAGTAGMCGFWPYARWLAATAGVRVVLVNRCGYGQSVCPREDPQHDGAAETAPAVDWLREHGARRITLVGASSGGSDALGAAGSLGGASAVVDLSGDGTDVGNHSDAYYARRVHVPTLLVVAAHDAYCPLATVRAVARAVAGRPRRLIVVRSMPTAHGWSLLHTPSGTPTPVARTVAGWIVGRYGPSPVIR